MKLTELISVLTEAYELNGEMEVAVCVDGSVLPEIEINATDNTLYVEGYHA